MPREMLNVFGIATVPFLIRRSGTFTSVSLFVSLRLVTWLMGAPGALIAYCTAVPRLVGFIHFLTTRHAMTNAHWEKA